MGKEATIIELWPRWLKTVGAMRRARVDVRSRCAGCGAVMRVDLDDILARHGAEVSLIDRLERCRLVPCMGTSFYMAKRGFAAEWRPLLRAPEVAEAFTEVAPVLRALG